MNAYNAFAIRTIIQNYPTKSIRDIGSAFTQKTHNVGGQLISLDDIEKGNAIPAIGADAHAIVVCCAKSCPPLQQTAYTPANIEELADTAFTKWFARKDLTDFKKGPNQIAVSKIFKWYESDFAKEGGTRKFVTDFAPAQFREKAQTANISYLSYNWKLNEQ